MKEGVTFQAEERILFEKLCKIYEMIPLIKKRRSHTNSDPLVESESKHHVSAVLTEYLWVLIHQGDRNLTPNNTKKLYLSHRTRQDIKYNSENIYK